MTEEPIEKEEIATNGDDQNESSTSNDVHDDDPKDMTTISEQDGDDPSTSSSYPPSPCTKVKRHKTEGSIQTFLHPSKVPLRRVNSEKIVFNGQGIDAHPYARGSIIEVIYGLFPKKTSVIDHASVDDEEEDFDEADEQEDERDQDQDQDQENNKPKLNKYEVRLADIIDRAPSKTPDHEIPGYRWKYYIHYRDCNRRMDEWITDPMRIVSPPSVGNAKVRAMKKEKQEEERKARERELKEKQHHQQQQVSAILQSQSKRKRPNEDVPDDALSLLGRPVSQRASSRRASAAIAASSSTTISGSQGDGIQTTSSASLEEQERLRLTRSQRRKSSRGIVAGIESGGEGGPEKKDVVAASSTVVTTLLPETELLKDRVVTVAAQELDEHEGLDEASLREHEEVTKVKNVHEIELGKYKMDTWYFSPLPKELMKDGNMIDVLYVCEFSLNFFTRKVELVRYQHKNLPQNRRHPPGNEIYRNGNLSMFEVDGYEERIYCQNLCYIAKLFLDHKTLYFDVDPFLFYVLCEVDDRGFHPVGYFSKEKYSDVGYNLACILTFPCHQRKGYGRFLIDFSYELSKKEEKVGSPEKPMSDLGQQAYKPYWTSTIVDFLMNKSSEKSVSIMDISKRTSIMAEDIIFTLNMLGLLKYINGVYFITAERTLLQELAKKHPVKEPRVDPSKLHWTPYLTDVKRDKFSIHSKKPSIEDETVREKGGF
eukprot:CAMPEP_0176493608 /NCGR_PEP_ID=MMETSP0200_2-20121128/9637_1 /TAXON_ID=947934 /ORGANISM="Chaetoceros sp., Strain GSL56" /LENGTH=710 /DNA_ID=CAMNT_0017891277 /DNA_START=27 /DNA_END=2159 /DNA_ORIENTATION=+